MSEKQCKECGQMKPLSAFMPNPKMRSGCLNYCRECLNARLRNRRKLLTVELLKKHLHYDPETGVFTRLITTSSNARAGTAAGQKKPYRYVYIGILGALHRAHRLAWLYMTGEWPSEDVDHIDGDCTNNRWTNLRLATDCENLSNRPKQRNNTSGHKGVIWKPHIKKWVAQIVAQRKFYYLGVYETKEKAAEAYKQAAIKLHGHFARVA